MGCCFFPPFRWWLPVVFGLWAVVPEALQTLAPALRPSVRLRSTPVETPESLLARARKLREEAAELECELATEARAESDRIFQAVSVDGEVDRVALRSFLDDTFVRENRNTYEAARVKKWLDTEAIVAPLVDRLRATKEAVTLTRLLSALEDEARTYRRKKKALVRRAREEGSDDESALDQDVRAEEVRLEAPLSSADGETKKKKGGFFLSRFFVLAQPPLRRVRLAAICCYALPVLGATANHWSIVASLFTLACVQSAHRLVRFSATHAFVLYGLAVLVFDSPFGSGAAAATLSSAAKVPALVVVAVSAVAAAFGRAATWMPLTGYVASCGIENFRGKGGDDNERGAAAPGAAAVAATRDRPGRKKNRGKDGNNKGPVPPPSKLPKKPFSKTSLVVVNLKKAEEALGDRAAWVRRKAKKAVVVVLKRRIKTKKKSRPGVKASLARYLDAWTFERSQPPADQKKPPTTPRENNKEPTNTGTASR